MKFWWSKPDVEQSAGVADDSDYLQSQFERVEWLVRRALALTSGETNVKEVDQRLADLERRARERMAVLERGGSIPGLEILRRRFALEQFDIDTLLLATATLVDSSFGKYLTKLSGVPYHPWLDVSLAIQIRHFSVATRLEAVKHFQPDAPLLRNRLIYLDRNRPEARQNLLAAEIKLPPRVSRLIIGSDIGGDIQGQIQWIKPADAPALADISLPAETKKELNQLLSAQREFQKRLKDWGYADEERSKRSITVMLTGESGTGKTSIAKALAHELGRPLLLVDCPRMLELGRTLDTEFSDLLLEAEIQEAVVLFDNCEGLFGRGQPRLPALLDALDRFGGLVLFATASMERLDPALDRRALLRLTLDVPTPDLRQKIWEKNILPKLKRARDVDVMHLAKRYELTGGAIQSAVLFAVSKAAARGSEAELKMADLEAAAQAQMRGDLSAYAEKTRASTLSLEGLVLPATEKAQIAEIINAGRSRAKVLHSWGFSEKLPTGKGLVVLFSGDPGTGKTLAAEVIAAELGLHLYRVNPAKVVSKYVGETEKNLHEILSQAKSTHSILFFDEADAFFSSRVTKVESANDRFVNMETNFLLQQLERYEGIVILATNLDASIDQAFKRRIAYHVVIPFPTPADRERIWRTLIPEKAPVAKIDFAKLGRTFELSGGHIKNAILRAAYTAAAKNGSIDFDMLADAAEKECAAAGKLFQHL